MRTKSGVILLYVAPPSRQEKGRFWSVSSGWSGGNGAFERRSPRFGCCKPMVLFLQNNGLDALSLCFVSMKPMVLKDKTYAFVRVLSSC